MSAQDLEQRARELLAAEYERDGRDGAAFLARDLKVPLTSYEALIVRTVVAALRQQPAPVDLEQFREAVGFYLVQSGLLAGTAARYGYSRDVVGSHEADRDKAKRLLSIIDNAGKVECAGNWIAADDVRRLTREIDVALNGEAGAAPQAALCDIAAQVKSEVRKRGAPLLAAPVVDDARMARALDWVRKFSQFFDVDAPEHLPAIEEAIAAYNPNCGARTVRAVDDAMRENAARYEWLRKHGHPDSDSGIAVAIERLGDWGKWKTEYPIGYELDAAIDFARAQGVQS